MTGQVVPIKLDAEKGEGKTVARKYNVTGFPTILFINESGRVEATVGGYLPTFFGQSSFGLISIFGSLVGGVAGIFAAQRIDVDL